MKKYRVEVYDNGNVFWYKFGTFELHREDGPAVVLVKEDVALTKVVKVKEWFLNNKVHREDGPAVEHSDGYKKYYIHGKEMTKEEFLTRQQASCDGKIVEIDGKKYTLTAV